MTMLFVFFIPDLLKYPITARARVKRAIGAVRAGFIVGSSVTHSKIRKVTTINRIPIHFASYTGVDIGRRAVPPASRRFGSGFACANPRILETVSPSARKRRRPVLSATISGVSEPVIRNSQNKICFRICWFCESLQGNFTIDGRDYSY